MFEQYLSSIENINPKYRKYAIDLTSYITSSIDRDLPLYATHGFCTDGGVAGSMIRYAIEGAAIIPLDYWILNDDNVSNILSELSWKGIVDLKPFNKQPVNFWVDHHISAMDMPVNAKKIRFDIDGKSGAYQLLQSNFLNPLPEKLIDLALMTKITDTASYKTEPPIEKIDDLSDFGGTSLEEINDRTQYEQRVWLLDDAFGSMETLKDHLNMFNYLAKDGFLGLSKVLKRVNERRAERKEAYNIANSIEIDADIVMFSFEQETQDKFTILRRLQKRGAKVVVSLSITENQGVKISLRRNRNLSSEEQDKIQLQKVAKKLNGGGHAGASGAVASSVEEAFNVISNWGEKLNLSSKLVQLS